MVKKSYKQLIWAFILMRFGIYQTYNAVEIYLRGVYLFAAGSVMGQASVFILWGLREWIGYSIKRKNGK